MFGSQIRKEVNSRKKEFLERRVFCCQLENYIWYHIECGLAHMVSFPYISQRFAKDFFRLHCGSSSGNPLHYAFIFPKMVLSARFLAHSEMSFKRSCQMLRDCHKRFRACPF
ncbi:hypothetical protein CDAR_235091 [Caerostris darwini]|uniref:Maturase K n=1 Tax=Caerostris darwini TaxID=1538125 RepID=A0AAV4MPV4_9ARAC|nr:hypothetical protein CDAR_235091 [Caerostris darwini]